MSFIQTCVAPNNCTGTPRGEEGLIGIKSCMLTLDSHQLLMLGKPNFTQQIKVSRVHQEKLCTQAPVCLSLGSVNLCQPNTAIQHCTHDTQHWYQSQVSGWTTLFLYVVYALNWSVPPVCSTHCCECNRACKRKYSCCLTVCMRKSTVCVCVCLCLCEGRKESDCLCWLVRASSCTCRT